MLKANKKDLCAIPDLSLKEIIDYYSEIQIIIKPNDILKPTMPTTLKLFDLLLELYKGENTADILIKHRKKEDFLEYEDSLFILSIYKRMTDFLRKIGMNSFCLRNITVPESNKLINILSAMVNFSMYRDSKRDVYEKIASTVAEREKIKNDVTAKIKKSEANLKKLKKEFKEQEESKRNSLEEVETLENELKHFLKQLNYLSAEIETAKEKKNSIADQLGSAQLEILDLKQEISSLKTQIISDPRKLLELLDEMRCMIIKEGESIAELKRRKIKLGLKLSEFDVLNEKMREINSELVRLRTEDKNVELLHSENQEVDSKIKSSEITLKSLKIKLNYINSQISHLDSKIINLNENDKKNAYKSVEVLEELKSNYEKITDERNSISFKVQENLKESKHIEFETFKLKNEHTSEVTDLLNVLCELKDKVVRYSIFLSKNMDK